MIKAFLKTHGRMVLWALAMLLLACMGLHQAPLFDVDEGAFSEATREMLASHDWGHTTLNGADRFDKPILIYWLQAASVTIFGLHEWALRLPSALAAWGWALALAIFARSYWGQAVGMLAGTILLTCVGVLAIGRSATADALLNLWLVLAALDLWRVLAALQSQDDHDQGRWRIYLRRAALWLGLGMLTKGPVAWLVPGAAVGIWWLVSAIPLRNVGRQCRACLSDVWAWLILWGVALPWYVYAWQRHGWAFVDGFFVQHNLQRYGGTLEGHGGSLFYYWVMVPILLLPWSLFLVPVVRHARELWKDGLSRYLCGWAAFVLVFFSLSGTKLPHYVLYGLSPLVLLMARALHQQLGVITWVRRLTAVVLILLPLLCAAITAWVVQHGADLAAPHLRSLYAALLAGVPVKGLQISAIFISAGVCGICILTWWRQRGQVQPVPIVWALPVAAVWVSLFVVLRFIPTWGEALQGPVRQAAQAGLAYWNTQTPGYARGCVQWGLHQPSIGLYLQQPCPIRPPKAGELALVREHQLPSLAQAWWEPRSLPMPNDLWDVIYAGPGFMLIHWRGEKP